MLPDEVKRFFVDMVYEKYETSPYLNGYLANRTRAEQAKADMEQKLDDDTDDEDNVSPKKKWQRLQTASERAHCHSRFILLRRWAMLRRRCEWCRRRVPRRQQRLRSPIRSKHAREMSLTTCLSKYVNSMFFCI